MKRLLLLTCLAIVLLADIHAGAVEIDQHGFTDLQVP
jgi:hypothetical protein